VDTTNGLCHAKKCIAVEASGLTMLLLAAMLHIRAPIIPKTLVEMGTLLNTSERVIPIAVTTRSTNHESANLGWRRVSPNTAMLGRGTIAAVTEIFPYKTIEVESVSGIRQFYPEDELEILEVM